MELYQKSIVSSTVSIIGLLLTIGTSTQAVALTPDPGFNFLYSGVDGSGSNVTATGELITGAYNLATNSYPITGITGARNSSSIDSLISPNGYYNDNKLLAGNPVLDFSGFSYSSGGENYNVFFNPISKKYNEESDNDQFSINFSLIPQPTPSATSVPEPSMLGSILGVGVIAGGVLLKRQLNSIKKI